MYLFILIIPLNLVPLPPITNQLQEARLKIMDMNKEQESLIDIFSEERERRDVEEENLRKKLKVTFLLNLCNFVCLGVEILIILKV